MAMIKRTGGADFPDKLKALVSGPPKSGKTTLLGTVPNIIVADTEPQANNLASLAHLDIPYVTVFGTADLRELAMVLGNDSLRAQAAADAGMPSIDAVAIDTLDSLQKIMKRERMEEQRTTKFLRDDWSWLKDEMIKIIEAFTSLPLHVIFCVHLKTQDVGTENNPQSKILPGLEGSVASEIAGMVGYSLRSFRKEEFDPASGNRYTKYLLQAEGDETYDFLGTRTAGRLPSIIEPNFKTIYDAAMSGRPAPQAQAPIQMPQIQNPAQAQAPQAQAPQAQAPAPAVQTPVQTPTGPEAGPAAPVQPAAQPPQEQAPQAPATPEARPDASEPVNDTALQHMKKVYDALGLAFPVDTLRQLTLGDARTLVKMWAAVQADAAEGKAAEGSTPQSEMVQYLTAMGYMPDANQAPAEQPKQAEAKLGGTIAEAKAYVGDGSDLARVQEAYDYETTVQSPPRKSMVDWLESKGAKAPTAPTSAPAPGAGEQEVQTPVQTQQPVETVEPVTQADPVADAPSTEQAVQAVQEGLGAEVISETVEAAATCEDCHKPIDDTDIAKLSKTRFNKILCVDDYIAATRA